MFVNPIADKVARDQAPHEEKLISWCEVEGPGHLFCELLFYQSAFTRVLVDGKTGDAIMSSV